MILLISCFVFETNSRKKQARLLPLLEVDPVKYTQSIGNLHMADLALSSVLSALSAATDTHPTAPPAEAIQNANIKVHFNRMFVPKIRSHHHVQGLYNMHAIPIRMAFDSCSWSRRVLLQVLPLHQPPLEADAHPQPGIWIPRICAHWDHST